MRSRKVFTEVVRPLKLDKFGTDPATLHKEIQSIKMKINEIVHYINSLEEPDTVEWSEEDKQRKKILIQPADMLTPFLQGMSTNNEPKPNKKDKVEVPDGADEIETEMHRDFKEAVDNLGLHKASDEIKKVIKKGEAEGKPKKKKKDKPKKSGDFFY